MNSNGKNMDLTFIDRKERKILSPSREVVSPAGHLYIPIGSPGQRSPGSENQCLSQKFSNSQEDASNNNGISLTDNTYFGDAFPGSLTSEQESALLRELEQDSVAETSGHLQFDMRYIDRKEANMQDISQRGSEISPDNLTGSHHHQQPDTATVTNSQENRGRTFSNSITMEINSAMSSPYVSVLSNPLSFKDEEEEEKCDSKNRAYEIRSTTSVMLFQERNLFADEKEAAEAGDTSSEGIGEDSVQLDHSDSWRSESMAAKLWWQADSQSSSAAEDLPEVEVFPAVEDITDSRISEESKKLSVQENFNATSSVPTHSKIAVSNFVSSTNINVGTEQESTQSRSPPHHEDLNQEVREELVSNSVVPQMTEPMPAVAKQSKPTPVKMIEVERKFVITAKCVDKLKELGASLNVEKTFTDRYYDDSKYSLTLQDCWFRQRNLDWELKVARRLSCSLSTQYEEITKEKDIVKYLIQHFSVDGFSEELSVSDLVKIVGLEEFATFTTHRQSYSLPECTVDLDITDFGFQVGEIEVMVTNESRIPSALNTIEDMAKKLGFQCLSKMQ
ncbi:uncharacterized protein LOC110453593 isoform X2 [Mizuhopecten yessoensis]|uniref:Thiamine-triphosphatase n=1 Tax=Mizuhopecten yessoensis TaxID=6573 RepID=A0A210QGY5_MIZYE|nr:uncharacterized protein LOC110453593 isoform X2 [Mizuhopecten yessoensis]OWF48008.1 Thiamine-triphosphatase [Mizuhopecten yessoensis]